VFISKYTTILEKEVVIEKSNLRKIELEKVQEP